MRATILILCASGTAAFAPAFKQTTPLTKLDLFYLNNRNPDGLYEPQPPKTPPPRPTDEANAAWKEFKSNVYETVDVVEEAVTSKFNPVVSVTSGVLSDGYKSIKSINEKVSANTNVSPGAKLMEDYVPPSPPKEEQSTPANDFNFDGVVDTFATATKAFVAAPIIAATFVMSFAKHFNNTKKKYHVKNSSNPRSRRTSNDNNKNPWLVFGGVAKFTVNAALGSIKFTSESILAPLIRGMMEDKGTFIDEVDRSATTKGALKPAASSIVSKETPEPIRIASKAEAAQEIEDALALAEEAMKLANSIDDLKSSEGSSSAVLQAKEAASVNRKQE